ncbi:MAG: chemotaxis protein CheA, partial [Myxococcota bacterium]
MIEHDDDLLEEFKSESLEHMATLEATLLQIENADGASSDDLVHVAFRAVHSVKGAAGFLDLDRIATLAHAVENVLGRVRDGELPSGRGAILDSLLEGADRLRHLLDALPTVVEEDSEELIASLAHLAGIEAGDVEVAAQSEETARTAVPAPAGSEASSSGAAETVRVRVSLLDRLFSLAGELVLTRNQLLRRLHDHGDEATRSVAQDLDFITSELQTVIMHSRLQPVKQVLTRYQRLVRDLEQRLGKPVDLEIVDNQVELDRSILELLADPLTHLIRNAFDHGLETTEERVAAGKPPRGNLRLSASHAGGRVTIEIADDGQGIDAEKIRSMAVERGIIDANEAATLSEARSLQLIFAPGFSTAEQVSEVSGRGVGMDVVHTNVEKLSGAIEVHT